MSMIRSASEQCSRPHVLITLERHRYPPPPPPITKPTDEESTNEDSAGEKAAAPSSAPPPRREEEAGTGETAAATGGEGKEEEDPQEAAAAMREDTSLTRKGPPRAMPSISVIQRYEASRLGLFLGLILAGCEGVGGGERGSLVRARGSQTSAFVWRRFSQ